MSSPFKFLDAYQKEDHQRFFGRERETAQLYNKVFASNLTLLYGGSGTGKTSLINCGLGNKFYDTDWYPVFIRRGNNINDSLLEMLSASIDGQATNIIQGVKQVYLQYYRPVYLIFDQFEELFIMGTEKEQAAFYQNIKDLLASDLQAKVLFIIREEWIASLNNMEQELPFLFENRLRIERMTDPNIYRVIAGNCQHAGIEIRQAETTIPAIADNLRLANERIDLTNLQVYLDRLWRTAKKTGTDKVVFDPALVKDVGRMDNVLSDFLDEQLLLMEGGLTKMGVEQPQGLPMELLFAMVTKDGTKQAIDRDVLKAQLPPNRPLTDEQLDYCLDEFLRIKLLRRIDQ